MKVSLLCSMLALAALGAGAFDATAQTLDDLLPPARPEPVDHPLPQPVSEDHYQQVLTHSPFLRTLSFEETYALRGVAEIDGQPVATLFNRDTEKSIVVTADRANDEGLKLVEVVPSQDLTGVAAKIAVGDKEMELKFDRGRVAPKPKNGGGQVSSGKEGARKEGERRGPSKQDIDRYKSLSDKQKEKFRNYIRYTMQKSPNLSREERGNMIRGAMTKLADGRELNMEDSGGGSGNNNNSGGDRSGGGDRR